MKGLNRGVYAVFGVIAMLLVGLIYAWSVFSGPIASSHPDWSQTDLSLTFTIIMIAFCIGAVAAGFMLKKFSPRVLVIISAILLFAGFMLASVGSSKLNLYLGLGGICGFGSGLTYNASMSTMSKWFPDKQGLISGIMLMGFGLSSFIIGKVFVAMSPADGSLKWQSTFKIFAVVILIVLIICSLFYVLPEKGYNPGAGSSKKASRQPAMEATTGQMMKMPSFWCFYIWAIVISGVGLVLVAQARGIATQVGTGVPAEDIATIVGLISIFNGIGRIFFGALYDKKGHRLPLIMCMVLFVIATVILMTSMNTGAFALVVVGFVIGGFAYGCVTPMNSAIISDFFGRENYPMNYSVINSNLIIASFASTIAGILYDKSGSYMTTCFMMIILTVVGAVVFFGIRRPKSK